MVLEYIQVYHFRNLRDAKIDTENRHIIFVGNNGQGKSNLLESIYMLCYGSSFRTNLNRNIITFNHKDMSLIGKVINEQSGEHIIKLIISEGKRRIFVDNSEIKDRKALFDICGSIIFSHEDIDFIKGSPAQKRKFFDQTVTLTDPLYIDDLREYMGIVRQRNALLRDGNKDLLSVYNKKVAQVGIRLQKSRKKTVDEFNVIFPDLYDDISQNGLKPKIQYNPSWKGIESEEEAVQKLEQSEPRDIAYEMTTTGPHRDKYSVVHQKRDFIATASTGQMRLIALVLRSVQARMYVKERKLKPILLLDDVLLELDIAKRERFLATMAAYDQAFFTFLPDESYFKAGSYDSMTYRVENGICNRSEGTYNR
ncbi:MAG: DNA replication/repair protein RecF [Spirochaetota bacterium]